MALRPCLGCGKPGPKTRCPVCERPLQQAKRRKRPYTNAERLRRKRTVDTHVGRHGLWCPGDTTAGLPPHPPHQVARHIDLTAHHVQAVGAGGAEGGRLVVLCRARNSQIGARA